MLWRLKLAIYRRRYLRDARRQQRLAEAYVKAPTHPSWWGVS